jgi:tetratricopeptide (TPR) repeat protein
MAVCKRNELDKPAVQRLLSRKLHLIARQQEEIARLKETLQDNREVLSEYAREYYLMGNECITQAHDARAAIRCFDKALRLAPDFTDAWVRKGVTFLDIQETYEAQKCFNEAVRQRPHSFKTRYNRGKCHLLLHNYEEAVSDLLKAVKLKSTHGAAHEYLAEAYSGMGEEELAQRHRDIAEELRSGDDLIE